MTRGGRQATSITEKIIAYRLVSEDVAPRREHLALEAGDGSRTVGGGPRRQAQTTTRPLHSISGQGETP